MTFAQTISDWGYAGGYDAEVMWDVCCTWALGKPYDEVTHRLVNTLSGGEQKKFVLESLLHGPDEVLILNEPDNYLDVPTKLWLEEQLAVIVKVGTMRAKQGKSDSPNSCNAGKKSTNGRWSC